MWIKRFFVLCFAAVAVFAFAKAILGSDANRARLKWPLVPARVDELTLLARGRGRAAGRGISRTEWYPDARYSYRIDTTIYTSAVVSLGSDVTADTPDELRKKLGFRGGDSVMARVNPDDPTESVLIVLGAYADSEGWAIYGAFGLLIVWLIGWPRVTPER